jgi:hypothetical protein
MFFMRFLLKMILFPILLVFCVPVMAQPTIEERFADKKILHYQVFFNGVNSGNVSWQYLNKGVLGFRGVDVLRIDSDTKILGVFDLTSHEKIYLDASSSLPVRVERDLLVFGKKELIEEDYNQDEGSVAITKTTADGKLTPTILRQDKPIRHIMALLYFFPSIDGLKVGEKLNFNLPTCKVEVRLHSMRKIIVGGKKREAYFLVGTGGKRFNIWIDKEKKYPIRIEFIFLAGKVSIVESLN